MERKSVAEAVSMATSAQQVPARQSQEATVHLLVRVTTVSSATTAVTAPLEALLPMAMPLPMLESPVELQVVMDP